MTSDPSTGRTYTYGVQNELRTSGTFSLAYDALLRPADTSVSGAVTKQFTYDGMQIVAASNPGAGIAERYVWGDGPDELLVDYVGSGTATRRWAHQDERGSVIALSDAAGNLVAINKYDEFGKPQAGNVGRFQYTGQMWMPEVSLYHYKARTYSPTFGGRFLQTDPIGYAGGINLYAYVGNDPVNWVDPLGLLCPDGSQGCPEQGPDITITGPGIQCPPGSYLIQGRCFESAAQYIMVILGPSWTSTQGSGTAGGGGQLAQPTHSGKDACEFAPLSSADEALKNRILDDLAWVMNVTAEAAWAINQEESFFIYPSGQGFITGRTFFGSDQSIGIGMYRDYLKNLSSPVQPVASWHVHTGTWRTSGYPSWSDSWFGRNTNTLTFVKTRFGLQVGRQCVRTVR